MNSRIAASDRERGQALVEFTLVAPVLLLVLFGIIQMGLLFGSQTGVVSAVRNAARYASTYSVFDAASATAACPLVKSQLATELAKSVPGYTASRSTPAITYSWYLNPDGSTYSVRVTVADNYSHPLFLPIIGRLLDGIDGTVDGGLAIGVKESMRVEDPPLTSTGSVVTC